MGWRKDSRYRSNAMPDFLVDLPGSVTFPVENRRELVFEERRPTCVAISFGKRPSEVLLSRAFATFLIAPRRIASSLMLAIIILASRAKYHRSSTFISLNSAMRLR